MSEQILSKARETLAANYTQGQPPAALPAGFIDVLFDLGMSLFKGCLGSGGGFLGARSRTPQQVQEDAAQRPLMTRLAIRRGVASKLREEHGSGGYRHFDGDRMVNALYKSLLHARTNDLEELAQAAVDL